MRNASAFDKILAAANKMKETGGSNNDADKYWKAETDKAGNGYAVIRFLPGATEEDLPFAKIYSHGFKGPTGKWFIDNCPTTIGGDCPVCAANGELWNSGNDKDKDVVRQRKRKLNFVSNVLVISDPTNPENEGKVFLFKYGKKIFDKITDVMQPQFDDEEAVNPFDVVSGANFKLKIRRVEGFANFDKSEFDKVSSIEDSWDAAKESLHSLAEFSDPASFKDYTTLETRMKTILSGGQRPASRMNEDADDDVPETPARSPKETKPAKTPKETKPASGDEDDLDYFKSLAGDDDDKPF